MEKGKLTVEADYDLDSEKISALSTYSQGNTGLEVALDSKDLDAQVTLVQTIDDNVFSPSVSLKTGAMSYGWKRKVAGGDIESKLTVGKKLVVSWSDNAESGTWKTTATVPLDDKSKKTSFKVSRDFSI